MKQNMSKYQIQQIVGGGALHIFRLWERAIGKGIYFPAIGIKNGINFHNFGIRNGTDLQDFYLKYIRSDILFRKIGIRSGILFQTIGIRNKRNGYVFEASMACPRPKSGQVHPPRQQTTTNLPLTPPCKYAVGEVAPKEHGCRLVMLQSGMCRPRVQFV